jgi:hypothetical protein
MKVQYSYSEFKEGTSYRRVFLYEDNGDAIMTDGSIYEDEVVVDADADEEDLFGDLSEEGSGNYSGPEDG